ncbi:hypothetical protein [uncultured Legionella sp.]|uniref:hypothetical protein n=1 Tax=uncultured Legionella sp. TaxID=210934 RepID=UPI0026195FFF|nr:hypothetical protein [uncultured Legionella sp.]
MHIVYFLRLPTQWHSLSDLTFDAVYHISLGLGLGLAANRTIEGHSVRVKIQKTLADEEIKAVFEVLQCNNEQEFNSALKNVEHLIETHTPFMSNSQLEYCLNKVWPLLEHTKNNHSVRYHVLSIFDKLAKHIAPNHLNFILNQFKENDSINIPVFLKIAKRFNSEQWSLALELILHELEKKKHPASYILPELISSLSTQRKITSVQLKPLNNWIMHHIDDKDISIRSNALSVLKLLANRRETEPYDMLFDRVLEKLNGPHQAINEHTIELLKIVIFLFEAKQQILVQPLLNYLEYLSPKIKAKPFVTHYELTHVYRKTLELFSSISSVLSNDAVDRLLILLTPRETRLSDIELKLIQSLSAIMTTEQRLYALNPLLDDPANQNYQARAQAVIWSSNLLLNGFWITWERLIIK